MKTVEYYGPTDADIYLVGEAPGKTEIAKGEPFVGGSGRILNKMLMDVNIDREKCRISNVVRTRPPNNKFSYFYNGRQPSKLLKLERECLKRDIRKVKPNVVCAMGNEAMKALVGRSGITKWRGSVLYGDEVGCKIIPTVHPALVMRQWDYAPLLRFDLNKVKREGGKRGYKKPLKGLTLSPSFEKSMEELKELNKCDRLAFDIESDFTEDGDSFMTCIAFSGEEGRAVCIPFTETDRGKVENYFTTEEERAVLVKIKELLENEDVDKIAQNAQFDVGMLKQWYDVDVKPLHLDTLCMMHTVYPELPKDLGTMTTIFTDYPYYKHLGRSGRDRKFWEYNAMDALVTFIIGGVLEKEMKEFGVDKFYGELVHPLISVLLEMQLLGVKINEQYRSAAITKIKFDLIDAKEELKEIAGHDVNVNSPKQLKELLYEKMGFKKKYKRGTGKLTTNKKVLKKLQAKTNHPVFDLILSIREKRKLLSTYLETTVREGRMHTSYNIGGRVKDLEGGVVSAPETGRLSSSSSLIMASGTNLQNVPKGICRRMFVPDKGYTFVKTDLSQAEARVVAWLADEVRQIKVFEEGGDIHKLNASWVYNKNVDDITYEERQFAKRHVHAFNYGEGPGQFAALSGLPMKEARKLIDKYFDTFPSIKKWHLEIQRTLRKTRILSTPLGRKRQFFGRWGDTLFREAYAYIPQSTVADLLNKALLRTYKMFGERDVDGRLVLQVHDDFVVQCKDVPLVIDILKEAFNNPLYIKGRELIIPIDIEVGKNWNDMEEIKA